MEHPVYDVWLLDCLNKSSTGAEVIGADRSLRLPIELRLRVERHVEPLKVFAGGDLLGAELTQMIGDELGVEQREAASAQPGHEVDQRDLAGVVACG